MPERGGDGEAEVFSNPLPPADYRRPSTELEDPGATPALTNDDFRKLLMTPRATPGEAPPSRTSKGGADSSMLMPKDYNEEDDPSARRRKKKSFYAKLKKQEMEREAELAKKYRDRAQERREGKNDDYDDTEDISTTANYRAVAPDAQSGDTAANRRKQLIDESKYLGGDMEHTHLVKGLDYALLHKVRAEITTKEKEEEDAIESSYQGNTQPQEKPGKSEKAKVEKPSRDDLPKIDFKTKMARNIYRTMFMSDPPQRNELFLPGRLAYQVDLDDEFNESDIPTMLIRSKADCPTMESHTTLTTNDIVINKLTQILSYLRQGQRGRKLKKKDKGKLGKESNLDKVAAAEDIFGEIGSYVPNHNKLKKEKEKEKEHEREREREREKDRGDRDSRRDRDRGRDRPRDREGDRPRDREDRDRDREDRNRDRDRDRGDRKSRASYFEKPKTDDEPQPSVSSFKEAAANSSRELLKSINDKYSKPELRFAGTWQPAEEEEKRERGKGLALKGGEKKVRGKRSKGGIEPDSYAECYPGAMETADAMDDSDEEVDYSKMDQGNKKGPIGRWDFDTQEEYSTYMNQKEAMPKAAFQFGIKMSDGRKTRRIGGEKNEKAELDREWQQISQILAKRKSDGGDGGDRYKKPKY